MSRIFTALSHYAHLPLRLGVGLAMVLHGWPKVTDAGAFVARVEKMGIPYGEVLGYFAVGAEFLGGILIILGLWTRGAALTVATVMGVAIFYVHWDAGYFASDGGFEYPMLILLGALALFMGGPGKASVDAFRGKA